MNRQEKTPIIAASQKTFEETIMLRPLNEVEKRIYRMAFLRGMLQGLNTAKPAEDWRKR